VRNRWCFERYSQNFLQDIIKKLPEEFMIPTLHLLLPFAVSLYYHVMLTDWESLRARYSRECFDLTWRKWKYGRKWNKMFLEQLSHVLLCIHSENASWDCVRNLNLILCSSQRKTHNISCALKQLVSTRDSHHQATLKPRWVVQSNCAHLGSQRAYDKNMYV